MKKNMLSIATMSLAATFMTIAPASADINCGAGVITNLAVDVPVNASTGVSNATNVLIQLDYSLLPQKGYLSEWLGGLWISISYSDPVRFNNVLEVLHAAYLSGAPVNIFSANANLCKTTDSKVTITTCHPEAPTLACQITAK